MTILSVFFLGEDLIHLQACTQNYFVLYEKQKNGTFPFLGVDVSKENEIWLPMFVKKIQNWYLCQLFEFYISFISQLLQIEKGYNKKGYSSSFIDKCKSISLKKLYLQKSIILTLSRKELYLVSLYLGTFLGVLKITVAKSLVK